MSKKHRNDDNDQEHEVYDPLDYRSLGDSLMRAVLERTPVKLESFTTFKGAGVYLIYYTGENHPYVPYKRLAGINMGPDGLVCVQPIYAGKAEPAGADRGGLSRFGNHPPGGKRTTGQRPMWDTIHPGRVWAENMEPNRYSEEEILQRIAQFLAGDTGVDLPEQDQAEEADSDVHSGVE